MMRALWIGLVAPGLLALGAQSRGLNDEGTITHVAIKKESIIAHHTDKYRMKEGYVVRRGAPFTFEISTSEPLAEGQEIKIDIQGDDNRRPPYQAKFIGLAANDENRYEVEIRTPSNGEIGRFDDIDVSIVKGGDVVEKYDYESPLYIIFNPYDAADQTYLADENMRKEYLDNEYGKIFNGFAHDYFSYKWFYAQFDQQTLEAAFHVLSEYKGNWSSVFDIAAYSSVHQGWYADDDTGAITGDKKVGLVEGRWSDELRDYPGGTDPEAWVSTRDLFNEWKRTGRAAKYAQCYIFGAIQNSMMRALGIATRQLSAFDARIDESATAYGDKKNHHVINKYFTKDGTMVKNEGQIWNFHSWNDLWLHDVYGVKEGWCALDGTPPGSKAGPGPLTLIHAIDEKMYTITDMVSLAKSAERHILVECETKESCNMLKTIKLDCKGVRKIVTSLPLGDGEEVITSQYTDDRKCAYIPAPHDPWHKHDPKEPKHPEHEVVLMDVAIRTPAGVTAGDVIEGTVAVSLQRAPLPEAADENEAVTVDVSIVVETQGPRGEKFHEIARFAKSVVLDPATAEHEVSIPIKLEAHTYTRPYVHIAHTGKSRRGHCPANKKHTRPARFIEIRAIAAARDHHLAALDVAKVHVRAPDFRLAVKEGHEMSAERTIPVTMVVQNPYADHLPNVCASLHTAHLDHVAQPTNTVDGNTAMACFSLGPKSSHVVEFLVRGSEATEGAMHTLIGKVTGDFLPALIQHIDVHLPRLPSPKTALNLETEGAIMHLVPDDTRNKPVDRLQAAN